MGIEDGESEICQEYVALEDMEAITPLDEFTDGDRERSKSRNGQVYRRPSEQRIYARHARHLPSRTLAALTKDKDGKLSAIGSVFPYATLRLPRTSLSPTEEHAGTIASQLELNDELMQDDPMSELLRVETLRDMPQCLTVKRSIKAKLTQSVSQKSRKRPISYWKRLKYKTSLTFRKIGMTMREILSTMELWYHAIKSIEGHFGSGVATYFKFLRWLFMMNVVNCVFSICFIILPQSLIKVHSTSLFNGWDLLTGSGFFTNTIMYYGFYSNGTVSNVSGMTYNIPSAYFMTLLCCYIFTFTLLSIKVAQSYRKCYIESSGGIHNIYANKIFCGWDFGIASAKAADLRSATIYGELKELLAETEKRSYSNCTTRIYAIFIQLSMTVLVLTIMSGTGVVLWILLSGHEIDDSNQFSLLIVPLIITAIMHFFPAFISWLVRFEGYSNKRTALYVTMIRIYAMAVVVIGTLLIFWLRHSTSGCWQTALAQEIYRLILLDFIVSILLAFIAQLIHAKLHVTVWKSVGAPRFDIARNTLNLIYNQTLFWMAFYFSPLMSLVIILKMVLTFYIKKYGVLNHCEPPSRSWRAAQTHTLFLALAFLGMVGVLVTLGYIVTHVPTSDCGPFRGHTYTWEVVVEGVLQLKRDSLFWTIITELARPAIGAAILIGMCIAVYYLRAKAQACKEMVQILREMIVLEARDKEFLLSGFSKVADERWLFNHNPSIEAPRSSVAEDWNKGFVSSDVLRGRRDDCPPTPRPSAASNQDASNPVTNVSHPSYLEHYDIYGADTRRSSTISDPGSISMRFRKPENRDILY